MPFTLICSDPGFGAPLEEWQAWLEELRAQDPDSEDEGIQMAVEEAETRIAEIKDRRG